MPSTASRSAIGRMVSALSRSPGVFSSHPASSMAAASMAGRRNVFMVALSGSEHQRFDVGGFGNRRDFTGQDAVDGRQQRKVGLGSRFDAWTDVIDAQDAFDSLRGR